uniref:IL-40-like Ig domain-containing protein n=1 Tax=Sus scrofa TaxID=9823 RepID=A0A8D2BZT8_PIG
MWKKSLLMFLFSLPVQKAALDCERMRKTNEFSSPNLESKTHEVMRGQNVSLFCSHKNNSLEITYNLFLGGKNLGCHDRKGEPATFNLTILEARDLGPYKCKAQVSNCSKYSYEFNFTFVDPVAAPVLNISVIQTKTDQYIMLHCISFNGSLPINYTFFEENITISPTISKDVREPAEFNLTKSNTGEGKEYRCEAKNRLPNHAKYSQFVTIPLIGGDSCPFCLQLLLPGLLLLVLIVIILVLAFWMLPKYKARKAMKENKSRVYENTSMEAGIYANICSKQEDEESVPDSESRQCVPIAQDETEGSQEIHYATPAFQAVAPRDWEASNDYKTDYVYTELNF